MDWKVWENRRAGGAKLSLEEAERYVSEVILSRSIVAPPWSESEVPLYSPASLQSICRSRRVIQTLGMIVKSRHLEYYYQAVYLLQFLHDLYPDAVSTKEYGELLVYLKVEAVIFVACCSMMTNRLQAACHLMKQLFDDDDGSEHCDVPDKQCLRNIHNDGCSKLNQILYSSDELCLSNLSEQLSSCEYHKAMCKILEGFFKGINNLLPPPKIIKIIQDFQAATSTKSLASKTTGMIPSSVFLHTKRSLPSKQFAMFVTEVAPSSVTLSEMPPSPMTSSNAKAMALSKTTPSPSPDTLELTRDTSSNAKMTALSKRGEETTSTSKTSKTLASPPNTRSNSKMTALSKRGEETVDSSKTSKTSPNTRSNSKMTALSKRGDKTEDSSKTSKMLASPPNTRSNTKMMALSKKEGEKANSSKTFKTLASPPNTRSNSKMTALSKETVDSSKTSKTSPNTRSNTKMMALSKKEGERANSSKTSKTLASPPNTRSMTALSKKEGERANSSKTPDSPKALASPPKHDTRSNAKMMASSKRGGEVAISPFKTKITAVSKRGEATTTSKTNTERLTKIVDVVNRTVDESKITDQTSISDHDDRYTRQDDTSNDGTSTQDSLYQTANSSKTMNSPRTTEDTSNDGDNTYITPTALKFVSTHSRMKRASLPPERFASIVANMRCRRNLRENGDQHNCDDGKSLPRIKRVRIVLSPLTIEDDLQHIKSLPNNTGRASAPLLQQKESPYAESGNLTLTNSSTYTNSDDEDYEPPFSNLEDVVTVARVRRKRKITAPVRYVPFDKGTKSTRELDKVDNRESPRKSKRKAVPPIRYAPFAKYHQGDVQNAQDFTSDSESLISESVTSSISGNSPLVNIFT